MGVDWVCTSEVPVDLVYCPLESLFLSGLDHSLMCICRLFLVSPFTASFLALAVWDRVTGRDPWVWLEREQIKSIGSSGAGCN